MENQTTQQGNTSMSAAMLAAKGSQALEPENIPEPATAPQPSVELNGEVIDPKQKAIGFEDVEKYGKDIGEQVADVLTKGDKTARQLLMSSAAEYCDTDERMEHFLTGYALGLQSKYKPDSAKVMKSQARLVFKAMKVAKHRMQVGETVIGQPIPYEIKSGKEWLTEFDGAFVDFLKTAKHIADGNPSSVSKPITKVTDKGMLKQKHAVKVMTPSQAADIAEVAVAKMPIDAAESVFAGLADQIIKQATPEYAWENRLLVQIDDFAALMREKSAQPYFQKIGEELEALATKYLTELALAREDAARKAADAELQRQAKEQTAASTDGETQVQETAQAEAAQSTGTNG